MLMLVLCLSPTIILKCEKKKIFMYISINIYRTIFKLRIKRKAKNEISTLSKSQDSEYKVSYISEHIDVCLIITIFLNCIWSFLCSRHSIKNRVTTIPSDITNIYISFLGLP